MSITSTRTAADLAAMTEAREAEQHAAMIADWDALTDGEPADECEGAP